MRERVVVTGRGVVAPNGNNLEDFEASLRRGRSGIRHIDELEQLRFTCQVGGRPEGFEAIAESYFAPDELRAMNSNMTFAGIAALDAWRDAGLERPEPGDDRVNWDTGGVIGTGIGGMDVVGERLVPLTNAGKVRRLGSTCVEQVMSSNVSAKLAGLLALGNQVTTNSSACSTGTEAVLMASERIRSGAAKRMLAGGSEGYSPYIWAGFDSMRVTSRGFNDAPERASRPLSASASGFVPSCGAGILVLESLSSAQERGATIHAEVLGGAINCGGHRMGGSMTAPNSAGVRRCIGAALADAGVEAREIDAISGHLTATVADPREVENWAAALQAEPTAFPRLVATKSLIGHALGAAGAIECVAAVLMLCGGFLHPSVNCEDLHPAVEPYAASIVREPDERADLNVIAKAGFGFGDVNACVVLRRWS